MAISNTVDKYSTDRKANADSGKSANGRDSSVYAETPCYSTNTLLPHVSVTAGSGPTQN